MERLTAAQVQILGALAARKPMTLDELGRALSDVGMNLDSAAIVAAVEGLGAAGLTERTPAVQLGKFRITAAGRDWLS